MSTHDSTGKTPRTKFLSNWYRESEEFSTLVNYRILRAGHIQTSPDYHVHRHSVAGHELIFCLEGSGQIKIEEKRYDVRKGQLVWLPVQWPHEHIPDKSNPWEIVWLRIDGAKLNNISQILEVRQNPIFIFSEPDKVSEIYSEIFGLMTSQALLTDVHCDMLCSKLIFMLFENRSLSINRASIITHRGLGQLVYQIHSHYNDDWDIDKFMQYCQVSKSQLFRLFQNTFGQSPLKWLKNYRLYQARRLLVETNESVSRIAGQVGYNDPLHFSRDFNRATGMSPSDFRRKENFSGNEVGKL